MSAEKSNQSLDGELSFHLKDDDEQALVFNLSLAQNRQNQSSPIVMNSECFFDKSIQENIIQEEDSEELSSYDYLENDSDVFLSKTQEELSGKDCEVKVYPVSYLHTVNKLKEKQAQSSPDDLNCRMNNSNESDSIDTTDEGSSNESERSLNGPIFETSVSYSLNKNELINRLNGLSLGGEGQLDQSKEDDDQFVLDACRKHTLHLDDCNYGELDGQEKLTQSLKEIEKSMLNFSKIR
jgi:hypothetical protein